MENVENKNSSKMIVGFVFGLLAGIIGILFAQYVVGIDEAEKISSTQQSVKTLNDSNRLTETSRLSLANSRLGDNTLPKNSKEEDKREEKDEEKGNEIWETLMALGESKQ